MFLTGIYKVFSTIRCTFFAVYDIMNKNKSAEKALFLSRARVRVRARVNPNRFFIKGRRRYG